MKKIQAIKENPVMKEVLRDSFNGVLYNVANQGKYDSEEVLKLWDSLSSSEKAVAGGIIKGAINFLKNK